MGESIKPYTLKMIWLGPSVCVRICVSCVPFAIHFFRFVVVKSIKPSQPLATQTGGGPVSALWGLAAASLPAVRDSLREVAR